MSGTWKERGAAALLLLLIAGVFFAPMLATGRFFAPGDGIAQNFPVRVLAAEAWRAGAVPFWNPYNFSGSPLMASIHPGVFYPGNLAFLFLPGPMAMTLTALLAYWLAGLGTFLFSRAQGLTRFASLVASVTFMLGGFLVLNVQNLTILQVASLMPWLLFAIERFARTLSRRHGAAIAVVLALQVLAGHPQMVAYSGLVAACWTLYRGYGLSGRTRWRFLASTLALAILGAGLAAVQLLPTLDFIRQTQRAAIGYGQLVYGAPSWMGLPALLFPEWLGVRSKTPLFDGALWSPGLWRWWMYGYVGLGGVLLAGLGLLAARTSGRARLWGAIALGSFLLALGDATPLFRAWALLPVVNQMPYPHRHLLEFTFAMAMLAGLGAGALVEGGRRRLLAVTTLLGAAMLGFVAVIGVFGGAFAARSQPYMPAGIDVEAALRLAQPAFWGPLALFAATAGLAWALARRPSRAGRAAFVALVVLDLGLAGYHNGDWHFAPEPPRAGPERREGRSLGLPNHFYPYYLPVAYLEALELPGLAGTRGVRSVGGYDAFIDRRYAELLGMDSSGQVRSPAMFGPNHHGLDVLALEVVLADPKRLASSGWEDAFAPPRWRRLSDREGMVRYANMRALPRAWRVEAVAVVSEAEADRRLREDRRFDPRRTALVEADAPGAFTPGEAALVAPSSNRLELRTHGAGPGFVVVSESYEPGWRAFLGERELPVYRTDALVMGVAVPAGSHTVQFRYEPPRFRLGLAVSLGALIMLLVWGLLRRRT